MANDYNMLWISTSDLAHDGRKSKFEHNKFSRSNKLSTEKEAPGKLLVLQSIAQKETELLKVVHRDLQFNPVGAIQNFKVKLEAARKAESMRNETASSLASQQVHNEGCRGQQQRKLSNKKLAICGRRSALESMTVTPLMSSFLHWRN